MKRSSDKLPLKVGDWNDVQLSLQQNKAIVTLNGTVVCERPMEPQLGSRFGLFRYKRQSSQVRNLVLSGNWPQSLPDQQDMISLEQPDATELTSTVSQIANDQSIAPLAGEIVRTARAMAPDEAFEFLSKWVLPSSTHSNLRLHFTNATPSTSLGSDMGSGSGELNNLLCPVVELIRIAAQRNKLEQLAQVVEKLQPTSPTQRHVVNAFSKLIALESELDEPIQVALAETLTAVEKPYPKVTVAAVRNADFLVAWRAGQHPRHWVAGSKIARKLREHERDANNASGNSVYRQRVHALVGGIERFARAQVKSPVPTTAASQWTTVPYLKPEHRAAGHRPSSWSLANGVAEHFPAETWGQLYFHSPLRGKFEVIANRTTYGYKEVAIAWGMHSAEPRHDLKAVKVSKLMHSANDLDKEVKLPFWDPQAEFRMVVDGNKITTFTNGVQIHEQIFDQEPDPWLLIQTHDSTNFARVSNLRIVGSPDIPHEIDLIKIAGLASWRADIYGEWFRTEADSEDQSNVPWRRLDDELRGQLNSDAVGEPRESLLVYQRPMLEDGVVEFETWYEPGVFEVHPALGRSAFLLTPTGALLHQLTDAQHELSGLLVDNQQPIPASAPSLALKENDWNQVRLTLKGDQLTINVNGVDAATQTITERANLRQFGLFRYSNNQCRVRKLIYRGEWPKSLPSLESQQLALPKTSTLAADSVITSVITLDIDFTKQSIDQLQSHSVAIQGSRNQMEVIPEGLKLSMRDAKDWQACPRLKLQNPIEGDFEVTLSYKDLQLAPPKSGWGVVLSLEAVLGDPLRSKSELGISLDKSNQMQHLAQMFLHYAAADYRPIESLVSHPASSSGQLRLVRTGGKLDFYAASADSEEFVHLNSATIGSVPIAEINMGGNCSDEFAKMDVTFTRLTIRQGTAKAQ